MQTQTDAYARSREFMWKLQHLDDPAVTVDDLESMRNFVSELIADDTRAHFKAQNLAQRDAIDAELARRRARLSDAA